MTDNLGNFNSGTASVALTVTATGGGNAIYATGTATPYTIRGDNSAAYGIGVFGNSTNTTGGVTSYGVYGSASGANSYGVYGTNTHGGYGVGGSTTTGPGVYGTSTGGNGSEFTTTFATGSAIYAHTAAGGPAVYATSLTTSAIQGAITATNSVGTAIYASGAGSLGGIYFTGVSTGMTGATTNSSATTANLSASGTGSVVVNVNNTGVNGYGVYSGATNSGATAYLGYSNGSNGIAANLTANGFNGIAVQATSTAGYGVVAQGEIAGVTSESIGYAVQGTTTGNGGIGVFGIGSTGSTGGYFRNNGTGYALVVDGIGYVGGYLTKSGGGFRIDHPTDPENSFINHEFVESDTAKNTYSGNLTLDTNGEGTVVMDKDWFPVVSSDPSISLTPKSKSMPNLFWDQIDNSTFKISGGIANGQVSWTITCLRSDAWQKKNHPGVVISKKEDEKGFFMHPELFGKDNSLHIMLAARTQKN